MSVPSHLSLNGNPHYTDNGGVNEHFSGDSNGALSNNSGSSTGSPDRESIGTKEILSELDLYANSRYEAMLLREDTANTNWWHNVDMMTSLARTHCLITDMSHFQSHLVLCDVYYM
ncbi:hypothetical protein GUJ93_ZPchr0007g3948 [Zizania palustris]|uniref:Uncharacterized protein n=1 Tax=Zizania palustris TaxID=103762 RepID=A0A8J5T3T2_ZIZPA|nr:hypothetical protein GUJ93_ZPchr0007g3948 [Zizania palustris]